MGAAWFVARAALGERLAISAVSYKSCHLPNYQCPRYAHVITHKVLGLKVQSCFQKSAGGVL